MKNLLIVGFVFLFAAFTSAQSKNSGSVDKTDVKNFRYKAEKAIPAGTVLHYVKTNLDGSRPEYVSQYIASKDVIEALKFHPKGERAGLVIAEMDWTNFSAKDLKSFQVFKGGERRLFASLAFDAGRSQVEVSIPVAKKESEFLPVAHLPFHIYNFDFGSLNFAFAHLKSAKKSFTIGIADPTFNPEGALMEYRGEVTVEYVGEEKRNGADTRKYRVDGAGLKNRGGYIWVNREKNHFEDVEIELADNPDWTSFKFRLLKTEKMTRGEWENFIKAQF